MRDATAGDDLSVRSRAACFPCETGQKRGEPSVEKVPKRCLLPKRCCHKFGIGGENRSRCRRVLRLPPALVKKVPGLFSEEENRPGTFSGLRPEEENRPGTFSGLRQPARSPVDPPPAGLMAGLFRSERDRAQAASDSRIRGLRFETNCSVAAIQPRFSASSRQVPGSRSIALSAAR